MSNNCSYQVWLSQVDIQVATIAGLSIHDLTDQPLRDWYDVGYLPREAAHMALDNDGFAFETSWDDDEDDWDV